MSTPASTDTHNTHKVTTTQRNRQHKHCIIKVLKNNQDSCGSVEHHNLTEIKERWQLNVEAFLSNDPEALAIGPKGSREKRQCSTKDTNLMQALCHCLGLVGAPMWRFTTGPWIHQRTLVINMDESTGTAAVNYMIHYLGLRQAVLVDEFIKQGPGFRVHCKN
jgi:hypothetical protein